MLMVGYGQPQDGIALRRLLLKSRERSWNPHLAQSWFILRMAPVKKAVVTLLSAGSAEK
jgi:hypothetical protein